MDITIRASLRVQRGMTDHPLKWAFVQGSELGFDGLELCLTGGSYQFVTSSAVSCDSTRSYVLARADVP